MARRALAVLWCRHWRTAIGPLLWRLRCRFGGGCCVGEVYRQGGVAAVDRLVADLERAEREAERQCA